MNIDRMFEVMDQYFTPRVTCTVDEILAFVNGYMEKEASMMDNIDINADTDDDE